MEFVESRVAAYDTQYRAERDKLAVTVEREANWIGLRDGKGLFLTSIFDTAFRLDRILARIRRQEPTARWRRVLVVGPGLNIVDQFLGTQVPVSSPQPVCLLESLFAHKLTHESMRIDLVDLNPEVIGHWREVVSRTTDYHVLGYLIAGEKYGELSRLTRAYLEDFGIRTRSSRGKLFDSRPPSREILWANASGELRPISSESHELYVRDLFVQPPAMKRFSILHGDIVTDRISDPGAYDLVVVTNLLLYFDAREAALAVFNVGRLLKPGGYLLVTENLGALLPPAHPIRHIWTDDMKEVGPPDAKLPSLFIYKKEGASRHRYEIP